MLQLDDVAFRVGGVHKCDPARARDVHCHPLAEGAAARRNHCVLSGLHVVYRESDVGKPRPIDGGALSFFFLVVLEDFQRWPGIAIARQPQVHATNSGVGNSRGIVEPLSGQVSLWQYGRAAKDLFVKRRDLFPVLGDEIGVNELGLNGHARLLLELISHIHSQVYTIAK